MKTTIPYFFKSNAEWDPYIRCFNKTEVGDHLVIYTNSSRDAFARSKTNNTIEFPVIKKELTSIRTYGKVYALLIGSIEHNLCLYGVNKHQTSPDPTYQNHKYVYWIYPWEALIHKIIKKKIL